MFADDLLVCGQATLQEATIMSQLIQSFCARSGQIPNWNKSGILFSKGVDSSIQQAIKNIFPVVSIDNNFIHLGHPLILPAKDRSSTYNFIVDKFKAKLPTYKATKLSHAGRLTLINYVFASIPIYYVSNILFPKKFLAKLTSIIKNFWWAGVREETNERSLCLRA